LENSSKSSTVAFSDNCFVGRRDIKHRLSIDLSNFNVIQKAHFVKDYDVESAPGFHFRLHLRIVGSERTYEKPMDVISALGLLVVMFLAFGVMAGARAPSILRPTIRIVERLLTFAVRSIVGIFGAVFRISGGSIKLPKGQNRKSDDRIGPPPPRWKD
jgi:hypothetical protein